MTQLQQTRRDLSWKRSSKKSNPCPICGKGGQCRIGTQAGSYNPAMVVCWNNPSDRLAGGDSIGGWLHILEPRSPIQAVKSFNSSTNPNQPTQKQQLPPLTAIERDAGFRAILDACQLLQTEADYLAKENVKLDAGDGDMVRSFRRADTKTLAAKIVAVLGADRAALHPAIKVQNTSDDRNYFEIACYVDGLLLPAIGLDGLVSGVQIRNSDPKCSKANRYRWVSCDGKGGTPLATFRAPQGSPALAQARPILITEGYKKAKRYGGNAIALAGVQAYKLADVLAAVDALDNGSSELLIAFDMDKRTNTHVARAEQILINKLVACRPTLKISVLEWDGAKGKGLDDALNAGLDLDNPAHFQRRPARAALKFRANGKSYRLTTRLEMDLPIEAHRAAFPDASKIRPIATLKDVQADNEAIAREIIFAPKGQIKQLVNGNVTGTGKTHAVRKYLAQIATAQSDKRFLLLLPDKRAVTENTAPDTPLGRAMAANPELVHVQLGRQVLDMMAADPGQAQPAPTPFDCHNIDAKQAGENRQIAKKSVCTDCPVGSLENYQAAFPGRAEPAWLCNRDGYTAAKAKSKTAQIVIATQDSYLNNSQELKEFDTVIIDESCYSKLLEQILMGGEVVAGWETRLEQLTRFDLERARKQATGKLALVEGEKPIDPVAVQLFADNWHKFFEIIAGALSAMPRRFAGVASNPNAATTFYPAIGVILDAARKAGLSRAQFFDLVSELLGDSKKDWLNFEVPHYLDKQQTKLKIPFRGAKDLLEALFSLDAANLNLHALPMADGTYKLEVYRVRESLIKILREKQLLLLDATPPPALTKLLPALKTQKIEARQPLEIWQLTSGLYTRRDLMGNKKTRKLASDAVAGWVSSNFISRPFIVVPKALQNEATGGDARPGQELALPAGAIVEHWGLHKASNKFMGCDAAVLMGHFVRPAAYAKAELDCIRAFLGETDEARANNYWQAEMWPDADDGSDTDTDSGNRIKVYNHVQNGQAVGRWTRKLADKELQSWLDYEYQADVMQAIGRLRAIRQGSEAAPLRVLIASSDPVGSLPIDYLVTARELADNANAVATIPDIEPIAISGSNDSAGNTPPKNIHFHKDIVKLQDLMGGVLTSPIVEAMRAAPGLAMSLETARQASYSPKYKDFEAKLASRSTPEAIKSLLNRVQGGIWLGTDGLIERAALVERAKKRLDELRRAG